MVEGNTKDGSLMAGQIAGLVKESCSCRELIQNTVREAEEIMKGQLKIFEA